MSPFYSFSSLSIYFRNSKLANFVHVHMLLRFVFKCEARCRGYKGIRLQHCIRTKMSSLFGGDSPWLLGKFPLFCDTVENEELLWIHKLPSLSHIINAHFPIETIFRLTQFESLQKKPILVVLSSSLKNTNLRYGNLLSDTSYALEDRGKKSF